jgi:hypothetical protein
MKEKPSIKFEPRQVLHVVEPVKVSKEVAQMVVDYQTEEADLLTDHLERKPKLKLI